MIEPYDLFVTSVVKLFKSIAVDFKRIGANNDNALFQFDFT